MTELLLISKGRYNIIMFTLKTCSNGESNKMAFDSLIKAAIIFYGMVHEFQRGSFNFKDVVIDIFDPERNVVIHYDSESDVVQDLRH